MLVLYCAVQNLLRNLRQEDSVIRDSCPLHHFVLIGKCSFIRLANLLCFWFCDCNSLVICLVIVLCLVFCDGDFLVFRRAIVIRLAFRDGDWLVFCHAIVICLAFCNGDLLPFGLQLLGPSVK